MRQLKCDVLICAVERGSEVVIPNGSFCPSGYGYPLYRGISLKIRLSFEKIGLRSKSVKIP